MKQSKQSQKGIELLNRKRIASACGLMALFGVAWLATGSAVAECNRIAATVHIEAPFWWFNLDSISLTLPSLAAFVLMLWLGRDAAWRLVAIINAAGSLLFCCVDVQAVWWLLTRLLIAELRPFFKTIGSPLLWTELLTANVALSLSLISLWLCVRASREPPSENWQTSPSL